MEKWMNLERKKKKRGEKDLYNICTIIMYFYYLSLSLSLAFEITERQDVSHAMFLDAIYWYAKQYTFYMYKKGRDTHFRVIIYAEAGLRGKIRWRGGTACRRVVANK